MILFLFGFWCGLWVVVVCGLVLLVLLRKVWCWFSRICWIMLCLIWRWKVILVWCCCWSCWSCMWICGWWFLLVILVLLLWWRWLSVVFVIICVSWWMLMMCWLCCFLSMLIWIFWCWKIWCWWIVCNGSIFSVCLLSMRVIFLLLFVFWVCIDGFCSVSCRSGWYGVEV